MSTILPKHKTVGGGKFSMREQPVGAFMRKVMDHFAAFRICDSEKVECKNVGHNRGCYQYRGQQDQGIHMLK